MNIFRKSPPQDLSEWLHIATQKLAPMAIARISTDISSHYDEAVKGHLESGLTMPDALAAALAELGDAKAAARRFRETHLTQSEFRKVAALLKSGWRKNCDVHLGGLFGCLWVALALPQLHWPQFGMILVLRVVTLFILYEVVTFILSRRKNPRLLVLIQSMAQLNIAVGTFWIFSILLIAPPHPWNWAGWFYLLVSLGRLVRSFFYFRLRNRLGKVTEDWMGESGESRAEPL